MSTITSTAFRPFSGLVLLRIVVAGIMISHGAYRMYSGTVDDFGAFLNNTISSPIGLYLAWGITLFEVIGGTLLLLGLNRRELCFGFIIELIVGIIMVHLPQGWFVVGGGTGGIEYSVLLITCFIAIASPISFRRSRKTVR